MANFSLFAVTPIGLALVVSGILYFVVLGRVVLPVVKDKPQESGSTLQYFREVYGIQGEVYEARVVADSPLVGGTISDIEEGGRDGWIVAVRNRDDIRVAPRGDTELHYGTELAIMGRRDAVERFCQANGLDLKRQTLSLIHI